MKNPIPQRLLFLLRIVLLLMAAFTCWRFFFYWINASAPHISFGKASPAFLFGLRMDLAVTAYVLVPFFFIFVFSDFTLKSSRLFRALIWVVAAIITFVSVGNACIYHFWGMLLNYRAISYLKDPAEAAASVTLLQAAGLLTATAVLILLSGKWMLRSLKPVKSLAPLSLKQRGVVLLIWLVFLVTAARGGWQQLPLNESNVYFSTDAFLNHTAVNPVWHLFNDIKMAGVTNENPFRRMSDQEAQEKLAQLHSYSEDSAVHVLMSNRPNIVFIVLESFTAHLVGEMGGEKGITPGLDSMIRHGLLFSGIYSSGFRTDQGIVSVLNGWPATPYHSIMRSTDKSERLPSIPKLLHKIGYSTSFYYGGAPNFSNLGAYLNTQGFDRVTTAQSFDERQPHGRWGYHDEVVLSRQLLDVGNDARPFMSVVMTLSNHEPFDVPGDKFNNGESEADKFRNSAHYTDRALRNYFAQARAMPWFDNTLFVLVADHGHKLPNKISITYPPGRWIPMVFAGPALDRRYCNKRVSTMGGHHDLAATLLTQLGLESTPFKWSKNLLSSASKSYAYLPMENELVWNQPNGWFAYSYDADKITERSFSGKQKEKDEELREALAMMQAHYGAYLQY